MSDSWMVLKPKETIKKIRVIEDDEEYSSTKREECRICFDSECNIVGKYGTYNEFGSFAGVCYDCLRRLLYEYQMQNIPYEEQPNFYDEYELPPILPNSKRGENDDNERRT